jgi:hypothetical protein
MTDMVVENSTTDLESKGLNPDAACQKNLQSTKVEHSTTDPDIKGLNPAAAQHWEKMVANKLLIILGPQQQYGSRILNYRP